MGENEKSKMLGKNCPGREIAIHLNDTGASSSKWLCYSDSSKSCAWPC